MTTDHLAGHLRPGGHPPGGVRDSADVEVEQHRLPRTYATFAALRDATGEETAAVVQVLSRHGHAVDNGDTELLAQVFIDPPALDPATSPSHHTVNTEVKRVPASPAVTIASGRLTGQGRKAGRSGQEGRHRERSRKQVLGSRAVQG